jgi:hypothetical protein
VGSQRTQNAASPRRASGFEGKKSAIRLENQVNIQNQTEKQKTESFSEGSIEASEKIFVASLIDFEYFPGFQDEYNWRTLTAITLGDEMIREIKFVDGNKELAA